jgi:hypothetical protein
MVRPFVSKIEEVFMFYSPPLMISKVESYEILTCGQQSKVLYTLQ